MTTPGGRMRLLSSLSLSSSLLPPRAMECTLMCRAYLFDLDQLFQAPPLCKMPVLVLLQSDKYCLL